MTTLPTITPETGIVGTEGGLDYLRLASCPFNSLKLGVKVRAGVQPSGNAWFFFRFRCCDPQYDEFSESPGTSATEGDKWLPHFPMKKVDPVRASVMIGAQFNALTYDSVVDLMADIHAKKMVEQIVEKLLQPVAGMEYGPDECIAYLRSELDTQLHEGWAAVAELFADLKSQSVAMSGIDDAIATLASGGFLGAMTDSGEGGSENDSDGGPDESDDSDGDAGDSEEK